MLPRATRFFFLICLTPFIGRAQLPAGSTEWRRDIQPVLEKYCYDCHADGANKGNVAFDEFASDQAVLDNKTLWDHALKNLRAGLMPPFKKSQPTPEERDLVTRWIKQSVFQADPKNPDPGRVTLRRLNRVEYHNTIHDLLGVDYDTASKFPADDTGYGFDNIGDVLTLPPMLMEKYILAANAIIQEAVPIAPRAPVERRIAGKKFTGNGGPGRGGDGPLVLSYYRAAAVSNTFNADRAGKYQLDLALTVNDKYVENVSDYNKCRLTFKVDGESLLQRDFSWEGGKPYRFQYDQTWTNGEHLLEFVLEPLTPEAEPTRTLSLTINAVTVRGPMADEYWVRPRRIKNSLRRKHPPVPSPAGLTPPKFSATSRAAPTGGRWTGRRLNAWCRLPKKPTACPAKLRGRRGGSNGSGAGLAAISVPRGKHRAGPSTGLIPWWTNMRWPRAYLIFSGRPCPTRNCSGSRAKENCGRTRRRRRHRMLADPRSKALISNFTGQWLEARDVESWPIEAQAGPRAARRNPIPTPNASADAFLELVQKSDESLTPAEEGGTRGTPRGTPEKGSEAVARRTHAGDAAGHARGDRGLLQLHHCGRTGRCQRCWTATTHF